MTTLDHAIKVAIQVTKKSPKDTHHTVLLNEISERLGYKDYRALLTTIQKTDEPVKEEKKTAVDLQGFMPVNIKCFAFDELVSTVEYQVNQDCMKSLIALDDSSKSCGVAITHPHEQEKYDESIRYSIASGIVLNPNGKFELSAQVFDKHMCSTVICSGWLDLALLVSAGTGKLSGDQNVGPDYIWHESTRTLYMIGVEAGESIEQWLDDSEPEMQALVDRYFAQK